MDSCSKNDDDGDTATKYVLDYYKRYSQNKELPKYFTGTSISYLPKIEDETPEYPITIPTEIDKEACEVQQSFDTSRASSVMSNRKLEWDNGADIGYENMQDMKVLRKSISLPVITDIKQSDPGFDMGQMVSRLDRARSEGSSDSNGKVILVTFASSSESQNPDIDNLYSSSSSHPEEKKFIPYSYSSNTDSNPLSKNSAVNSVISEGSSNDKIAKFASSLSYLKQKIGLPGAHSTPKYLEARKSDPELFPSTPVTHKLEKSEKISKSDENVGQADINLGDKSDISSKPSLSNEEMLPATIGIEEICKDRKKYNDSTKGKIVKYKSSKTINLALTKPITVECVCSPKTETKPLQVVIKHTSVGIQTDTISEKELVEILHKSNIDNQNQSLLYFEYSDSDKTHCGTQTNSDVTSACDSFEYYKNSGKTPLSDRNKIERSASKPIDDIFVATSRRGANNLNKNQGSIDSKNENSHRSSSNNICLGEIISTSQLDNIGDSVEKSVHLLHKLLKSKKYDPVTKKRYVKKLMQKISESKYLTESSASSELFCPKKSNIRDVQPPKPVSTDTSDEKHQEGVLHVKLPLYALTEKAKISPRKKKLGIKTFIQDFLPEQNQSSPEQTSSPPEIIPVDLRDTKNRFTLTNKEFRVKREQPNQRKNGTGENETPKNPQQTDLSLEKQDESSTSKSVNYQNWREDKTVSEKLLEEKSGTIYGEGDCLVQFAEKEREYQINWINNEISHLGKLKGLLEKPVEPPILNEPLENIKKTTTVYTVFEEHNQSSSKGVKFKRNYVIETHLGTDSTVPVSFNLKGTKYSVSNLARKRSDNQMTTRGVIGNIEVSSSDSVTSIKISTFCESCRRSPCTCGCSKCKKIPCICNMLKNAVCRVCHTIPCICPTTSSVASSKHHAHCLLDNNRCWRCNKCPCECPSPSMVSTLSGKTICLICHRNPCICVRQASGKGILSKTCLSCGKYPCIYGKSRTSTISDEYTGAFIVACPPLSAIEGASKKKCSTFPLSSKENSERNSRARCPICKRCPCICTILDNVLDSVSSYTKIEEICSICGKCPCVCATRSKTLQICMICRKCPCICEALANTKLDKRCSVCGKCPCICEMIKRQYLGRSSTKMQETCSICGKCPCVCTIRTANKGLEVCAICGKCPCICRKSRREYLGMGTNMKGICSICGKCPCVCDILTGSKGLQVCALCKKYPCICNEHSSSTTLLELCLICAKHPCICGMLQTNAKLNKTCSVCGECPCICEKIRREYTSRSSTKMKETCSICGKCPCVCVKALQICAICAKYPCICENPSSSIKPCPSCGRCPCICETPKSKLYKRCSVCGKCPCICETIKREYLSRGTSVSRKSLDKCRICRKHPCICEIIKSSSSSTEICSICGQHPCLCGTNNKNYAARSTSMKLVDYCALCGKYPCICDLTDAFSTKGTSISRKSLEVCSTCGKCPCICKTISNIELRIKNSTENNTGSLKRMFENCNCNTQTNCTCDFVEKLIERFNKVDVTASKILRSYNSQQNVNKVKCDCQHVGIQTETDRKHQILQTAMSIMSEVDNKISQTDRYCQNIAIQTVGIECSAQNDISEMGPTQIEVICCSEEEKEKKRVCLCGKLKSKKSSCRCDAKVDVGCTCEMTQGTQTLRNKRVVLTCSSQSDGSRTVSPAGRVCDYAHSTGISHLKKYNKAGSPVKLCNCGANNTISEEYDSKTESDMRCVTSSKSSSVMTSCYNGTVESASDQSSTKTGSLVICICCKEKYPSEKISLLGSSNQNFPLCTRCLQRRPILTSLCYAGPEHICNCYKSVRNDVLNGIKTTVNELCDLEFCTCTTPSRSKNSQYCTHCQMKLKKTAKTKNGIAYTLTLEDKKSPSKVKSKRKKKTPSLEEIRIRVPCPYDKKEHKDKVNLCRQDGDKGGVAVGYMERIKTDNDNKKYPKVKLVCGKTKRSRRSNLTLQDYLKKNKPDFINAAENRRQTLFSSRSQRELLKDEAKIRFFEDNKCHCSKLKKENTKMFTEQEMKAITRRNYEKLPEVKQKNNEQKERKLRNADKLIVDVFSTKIRKCALRGKRDFPLSQNIVSLPKA